MAAQGNEAQVEELTARELECGRRLAAAMFAMGKQQASIASRITKWGGFDRSAILLLKALVGEGPCRASTLATAVHSDPSTVSRQVATLVRAGLVERRPDQEDGRASLLAATPAGVAMLEEHRRRMGISLARVVQHWTPEELDRFVELLERFVADHQKYLPAIIDEWVQWTRSEGEN